MPQFLQLIKTKLILDQRQILQRLPKDSDDHKSSRISSVFEDPIFSKR